MGTRVDFYAGRGENAEWLGSYPWDGYPGGVFDDAVEMFAAPKPTEAEWRDWVSRWLEENADGATTPDMGWPWPWENSQTTDYAYAWEDGVIYGSCFGHKWFVVDPAAENYGEDDDDSDEKPTVFPDMTDRKAVTYGRRSGLIVLGFPSDGVE